MESHRIQISDTVVACILLDSAILEFIVILYLLSELILLIFNLREFKF